MKRLVVTFFFTGYVPRLPGTTASLVVVLLVGLYYSYYAAPWPLAALAASMLFAGLGLGRWAIAHFGSNDPKQFVLDEACGQLVAGLGAAPVFQSADSVWFRLSAALDLPLSGAVWMALAAGFVLFRALDILKPPPIRQAERLPAGFGIMADDLLAGLAAGVIVLALGVPFGGG